MRKVIAILFILFLLFNLSGYFLFYQYRIKEVKTAMKEHLRYNSNDKVVCFSIDLTDEKSAPQLVWDGEHEFMMNGRMYDVLQKKITGGKLEIRCIADDDETALIRQYQKDHAENNAPSKSRAFSLLKIATTVYVPAAVYTLLHLTLSKSFKFPFVIVTLPVSEQHILTPPPQIG